MHEVQCLVVSPLLHATFSYKVHFQRVISRWLDRIEHGGGSGVGALGTWHLLALRRLHRAAHGVSHSSLLQNGLLRLRDGVGHAAPVHDRARSKFECPVAALLGLDLLQVSLLDRLGGDAVS